MLRNIVKLDKTHRLNLTLLQIYLYHDRFTVRNKYKPFGLSGTYKDASEPLKRNLAVLVT